MQQNYQQKPGIDIVLKQAFFYWNKTLVYQLLFSAIYISIFLMVYFFFSGKYGIMDQFLAAASAYMEAGPEGIDQYRSDIAAVMESEGFQNFFMAIIGVKIFLYPLNMGFFQIYRKMDMNENTELSDLFVGYNGLNFFRYASYFMFWYFLYLMIAQTVILPVIWVLVTIFVAPLMFFLNKTIFEAISLNFKALKVFFVEILVCTIVAVVFRYLGFAVFLVGALFTLPFWNAMIYSLYKIVFNEKA